MKLIKIENLKFNIETVQFDIVNPTNTDFLFVEFEILLFDNDNIIAKKIEGCSYELNPNKTVQVSMSLGKTKKKFSHFEVYLKDIIY